MNRFTNAFSTNPHPVDVHVARPSTPPIDLFSPPGSLRHARSHDSRLNVIYDDPRSTHFAFDANGPSSEAGSSKVNKLHRAEGVDSAKSNSLSLFRNEEAGRRGWGMSNIPGTGRINSLAKGTSGRYAIGGGQYLRILKVSHSSVDGKSLKQIGEVSNLWSRHWGVSKSVTNLDWGLHQSENKLASATPSGNFLLFDVHRAKLEREVFGGHGRSIDVIRFCKSPNHGHLLMTGGIEGSVNFWDVRERDPSPRKSFKHSGSVTSLVFSPDSAHNFLVGLDNGSIQRYDLRSPLRTVGRLLGAHGNKAVTDLKWKDGDGGWLASAGEDRTVQVWDMSQAWDRQPPPAHILRTPQPIRRVAWRPGHDTELVVIPNPGISSIDPSHNSLSQGLQNYKAPEDFLEVWDVRRHHVAKYSLPIVDGTPMGADWWDRDTLMTAFRGAFAHVDVKQRLLPIEMIPRQVMAWNARGEMAYALDKFKSGEIPFDDPAPDLASHWEKIGKRPKSISDAAYEPLQAIGTSTFADVDPGEFEYLASQYKLEGRSAEDLCLWNRSVAESCGRHDDARIWTFLKLFLDEFRPTSAQGESSPEGPKVNGQPEATHKSPNIVADPVVTPPPISLDRLDDTLDQVEELISTSSLSEKSSSTAESVAKDPSATAKIMTFAPPNARQISEARSRQVSLALPPPSGRQSTSQTTPQSSTPQTLKSDADQHPSKQTSLDSDQSSDSFYPDPYGVTDGGGNFPGLSATPRVSIGSSKGKNDLADSNGVAPPMEQGTGSRRSGSAKGSPRPSVKPSPHMTPVRSLSPTRLTKSGALDRLEPRLPTIERIDPLKDQSPAGKTRSQEYGDIAWKEYRQRRAGTLLKWLEEYVNDGYVQLATTMLVVGRGAIDFPAAQSERIVHAYIDLLEAQRLSVQAAYVRRYSGIPSVEIRSGDDGMTHVQYCSKCGKSTGSVDMAVGEGVFWWCKRCLKAARTCVVCHKTVKGIYLGCRKCQHGGHQQCMRMYYLDAQSVPRRSSLPLSNVGSDSFDKPRTSGEIFITMGSSSGSGGGVKVSDGGHMKVYNACASGCGCRCRVIHGWTGREEHDEL